jgi:hypothetical protein
VNLVADAHRAREANDRLVGRGTGNVSALGHGSRSVGFAT